MKNENFDYYGDTIIRIADRKNWMKSFETNVLIRLIQEHLYLQTML